MIVALIKNNVCEKVESRHLNIKFAPKTALKRPHIHHWYIWVTALKPDIANFVWDAVDPKDSRIHGEFRGYMYKILFWKWDTQEQPKQEVFIPYMGRMDETRPVKGDEVTGSISDLTAYSTINAQVVVLNSHYTGPVSATVDVFTPEGSQP
ncbi:chemosensory receptor a [Plakobranchus ocellatus]|uniref:Chemosensory receptor a n=1 Tax=Plakobranchus ocellatus TaxID=259542 RepID=A0AAV3YR61_9GAST|nr:chemosensory receptor a [Plakobranchus ocellatus]